MQIHSNAIGALTCAQLSRMLQILEPYRTEPASAALLSLAARLARQEVAS